MATVGFGAAEQRLTKDYAASFAYRAARLYGIGGLEVAHEPGSRADFAQALQLLGANPKIRRLMCARSIQRGMRLHISCSRDEWEHVFGEVDCIEESIGIEAKNARYGWKHFCTDGPVSCYGHLFERRPGLRWVVVVQVSRL